MTGMPQADLRAIFARYPNIEAVYLFGSIAESRSRKDSDLDLAIVLGKDISASGIKIRLLSDLAQVGFCDVDLVFLDRADTITRYEAVRNNCLIYEQESFDHGNYYSRIMREYFDLLPCLEIQRKAYKRRLLDSDDRFSQCAGS